MILYPRHSRPATTCSALFRILVAVALTAELVNSLAPGEEPGRHDVPSRRDRRTSGSGPEEFEDAEDIAAPSSWSGGRGEERTKNVGLHLRSRDFDLTYTVPKTAIDGDEGISGAREPISDDELIARAIRHKIFLTPEEWDTRDKHRRIDDGGDNTYANRNGLPSIPEFKVKPECDTSTICNDFIIPYPESFVANLKNLESLWKAIAVPSSSHGPTNRMGDQVDDDKLCSTKKDYKQFPLALRKNLTDVWHLVINVPAFPQEFNIITCEKADSKCETSFGDLEGALNLNHSICRQQFVEQTVLVMNHDRTSAVLDSFPMPGGCCCNLITPEARFGLGKR